MIKDHRQLSDHDFISQLETDTLAPELFNHEAHVRVAWLYLRRLDPGNAISCISKVIRAMDSSGTKYNHTITVAFAILILKAMRENSSDSWQSFIKDNPDLCVGKKMLSTWYSDELLANGLCKGAFIPPDKARVNPEWLLSFFENEPG